MGKSESVIFNGIKFRRYPESESRSSRLYYVPDGRHRKNGVGRLHQEVYKAHNGPIPPGYHVHHADHNALNNDPSNLVLIWGEDHLRHHGSDPAKTAHLRTMQEVGREAAKVWHRSEEGRAWHVEHGKAVWEGREPVTHACEQCGNPYESLLTGKGTRFCSNNCKSQWRRESGVDNVDRNCVECGASFTVNKYMKTPTCSRSCGVKRGKRLSKERRLASAA